MKYLGPWPQNLGTLDKMDSDYGEGLLNSIVPSS